VLRLQPDLNGVLFRKADFCEGEDLDSFLFVLAGPMRPQSNPTTNGDEHPPLASTTACLLPAPSPLDDEYRYIYNISSVEAAQASTLLLNNNINNGELSIARG
jgi:hypothetical protein